LVKAAPKGGFFVYARFNFGDNKPENVSFYLIFRNKFLSLQHHLIFTLNVSRFKKHFSSTVSFKIMTAMIQQATTTPATKETMQVVRNNDIHQLAIKDLLRQNSLRTTMIYTHVSKKHISKIQSPLDKLPPSEYFNIE